MQILANIAVLTAIYALICSGYVLVYRVSRVLNLAHGELMMVGAYLLMSLAGLFAGSPVLAVAAALVLSLCMGVAVYVLLMRRMTGEMVLAAVLTTIALGILLRGVVVLVWTARLQYPLDTLGWKNGSVALMEGVAISEVGALIVAVAVAVYGGLFVFFRFTRWGVRMRAAGENPLLAAQRGIALYGIYALAWGLAVFTGGTTGMLLAADSGLETTMVIVALKAFPAALVGGLDSLLGAVIGSLIVATAEVLAIQYLDPLVSDVAPFLVLLAMLMVRPWGLFGTREEFERV